MKFLTEKDVKIEIAKQLKSGSSLTAAVAFWGKGAGKTLNLTDHREKVKIVCNLAMGGTNPNEIDDLLKDGILVQQRDDLHSKVYLFDKAAIVGSSNASASGLSYQDTDNISWREGNILVTDSQTLKEIENWIKPIFDNSHPIKDTDIKKAKEIWSKRRALIPLPKSPGKTLLDVAKENPALFENRKIYVSCSLEHATDEAFKTVQGVRKNKGLDINSEDLNFYEDWKDIPTSSLIIDFFCDEGKISFEGFWETPNKIINIQKMKGKGTIQLVNKISSVRGLPLGKKSAWYAAVKKAMPIFKKDEIIPLNVFAEKYF